MNETEERIAAAARAAAATVRETPPLDLRRDPPGELPRPGRGRHLRSWGVPLGAAAAVLAIAATLVAVRDLPAGHSAAGHPQASHTAPPVKSSCAASSSAASAAATPAVAPVAGVPAYYVTLVDPSRKPAAAWRDACPFEAVVAGTFTGARLASVAPPAGSTFAGVTAAADDRTFVLDATPCSKPAAASQVCPRTWYLLRLDPDGSDPARLTRLPIPATAAGTRVEAMALSPDGRELAVALQPDANGSGQAPESLVLYSVATGAVRRTWTGPNGTILTPGEWFRVDSVNATLSWLSDDHTLAFGNETAIRTLDTTGPGPSLISDSTLVWTYNDLTGNPPGYRLSCEGGEYVIDVGTSLVCGASGMPAPARHLTSECSDMWDNAMGFLAYSTATRRFTRALYIDQTTCTGEVTALVYWASRSGGAVIGLLNSAPEQHPAARQWNEVAVISGGRVTKLPIPLAGGYPMLGATAW